MQFAALATAVAGCLTLGGLLALHLITKHLSKPSRSPLAPLVSPASPPATLSPLSGLVYNVRKPPNLKPSQKLQIIVDEVVNIAAAKGLPTTPLSITLIDLNSGEFAGYQQEQPRFPASVVKMFWMVALYAPLQKGIFPNEEVFTADLQKMIKKSDNEAASRILDEITNTESASELEGENYQIWLSKRKQLNNFFQEAGYEDINVSQKAFPIPYLKLYEPKGREQQMRGNPTHPIRNKITTFQAARLLYEIVTMQAISQEYSEKMMSLLTLDAATRTQNRELQDPERFNPVRGFFSQSLPDNIYFAAKAGWTSRSRQEAAYIATPDGESAYILVIFAEHSSYAYDWKIFPKMSINVLNRMKN
ncbi:serine hydrolase [Microcoleus sp. FACHB-SPT15]|nr:serine hydrolase [Microcoleus sp. FACHB-SPT15]